MSATSPPPQFSILRIKRRRTDHPAPLDALVIETPEPSTKRRKQNPSGANAAAGGGEGEDSKVPTSTDASSSNAAAGSRGIFRFATSVPLDSFSTPSKTRNLTDRIQSFLLHAPHVGSPSRSIAGSPRLSRVASSASLRQSGPPSPIVSSSTSAAPAPAVSSASATAGSGRKLPSSVRLARAAALASSSTPSSPITPTSTSFPSSASPSAPSPRAKADTYHSEKRALRYRIVAAQRDDAAAKERAAREKEREKRRLEEEKEREEVRRGLRIPTVRDSREIERLAQEEAEDEAGDEEDEEEGDGMKIYEAVAEEEEEDETEEGKERRRRERERARARRVDKQRKKRKEEENGRREREAMDQFGDMLKEYLTLQDSIAPSSSSTATAPNLLPSTLSRTSRSPSPAASLPSDDEDENDYVYDVYYRALPSVTGTSPSAGMQIGEEGEGRSAGMDVSSLEGLKRIGQLAGFHDPHDLSDTEEALVEQLLVNDNERTRGGGALVSDEEEEDEADQDSNEENDYRNDYPEGEGEPGFSFSASEDEVSSSGEESGEDSVDDEDGRDARMGGWGRDEDDY
ncbi:hypothetical protein JCM8547_005129 [Rhodosporidiobolus lusitaniae]